MVATTGWSARRTRRLPPALVLAATVLAATVLAACGQLEQRHETLAALRDAGVQSPEISLRERGGGSTAVVVHYRTQAEGDALRRQADELAEIVWERLPARIDVLELAAEPPTASQPRLLSMSRADLSAAFGTRDRELEQTVADTGRNVMLGVLFGLLLLVAALGLLVYLAIRRVRRRMLRPVARGELPP